jgi:hypothetical protein
MSMVSSCRDLSYEDEIERVDIFCVDLPHKSPLLHANYHLKSGHVFKFFFRNGADTDSRGKSIAVRSEGRVYNSLYFTWRE